MAQERIHLGTRALVRAARELDASKLLTLARDRAPDPEIFDRYEASFWQVKASSNRLDFYYTRMRPGRNKTLGNFKRGLDAGVSYLDSHNSQQNGLGQSLRGQIVRTDEVDPEIGKPIEEVWGDFFTLRGITINGHSTDDFLANIGAGVWRDVSVGFFASDIECGLCGKQVFDWRAENPCPHYPGLEYEIDGERVTAWAWINDGELSEVSQVYDGASPGAAVVKAEQMSVEGALPDGERARIEHRYNTRILLPDRRWAVPDFKREGGDMGNTIRTAEELDAAVEAEELEEETTLEEVENEEDVETVIEDPDDSAAEPARAVTDTLVDVRAHLAPHGIRIGSDPAKAVRALGDEVVRLRAVVAEKESLAAIGERYRADMIDATIKAGIRAKGEDFREETYRAILDRLDIDSIRAIGEDWGLSGDSLFDGGRRSKDEQEPAPPVEQAEDIDPDAFSI